jgi:hypothetical protein
MLSAAIFDQTLTHTRGRAKLQIRRGIQQLCPIAETNQFCTSFIKVAAQ